MFMFKYPKKGRTLDFPKKHQQLKLSFPLGIIELAETRDSQKIEKLTLKE